jgi:DNA-binding beta-propeller fold protein YncE
VIPVYGRKDHTPATAAAQPRRILQGRQDAHEFQRAARVDPDVGHIYAVNNDTIDALIVFDRNARGNVPPTRELSTPHGTFGIAVDERKQELFLTSQHHNAVIVFNKMASGNERPIRLLQGDRTGLADPHGMAVDVEKHLLFVVNYGARIRRLPIS